MSAIPAECWVCQRRAQSPGLNEWRHCVTVAEPSKKAEPAGV